MEALYIDQADTEGRNSQVEESANGEVYRCANKVVVWIGVERAIVGANRNLSAIWEHSSFSENSTSNLTSYRHLNLWYDFIRGGMK